MRIFAALALTMSAASISAYLNAAAAQAARQSYTNEQVRAYVAASQEVEPVSSRVADMTPQERLEATAEIRSVLQRHGLTGDEYTGIELQAGAEAELAQRIAAVRVENLNDETLSRFVTAAREIDPIGRGLATDASAHERAQAAARIGAALDRHGISAATYNAIAARAQSDETLAARIAALRALSQPDVRGAP
jgi:hypothetical protein